jgi:hypothetical protein
MGTRLGTKKFLELFDVLWQEGPRTQYKNPENWSIGGLKQAGDSLDETEAI